MEEREVTKMFSGNRPFFRQTRAVRDEEMSHHLFKISLETDGFLTSPSPRAPRHRGFLLGETYRSCSRCRSCRAKSPSKARAASWP